MNFIFDKNGNAAINPVLVKKFFIERIFAEGWEETKNFQAAKNYLAELVKTLNEAVK